VSRYAPVLMNKPGRVHTEEQIYFPHLAKNERDMGHPQLRPGESFETRDNYFLMENQLSFRLITSGGRYHASPARTFNWTCVFHLPKRLRTGAGGGVPRTASHKMSFNSRASARSDSLKSSLLDRSASDPVIGFFTSNGTRGGSLV
jgi:hypothetical protein